jgi:hypothetical protein
MMKKAFTRDERRAALALHRYMALDHRFRQRLANCNSETWSEWIAGLNRVILRLVLDDNMGPKNAATAGKGAIQRGAATCPGTSQERTRINRRRA